MCFASPGNPLFGFLWLLGSTNPSNLERVPVKSDMICVSAPSCPQLSTLPVLILGLSWCEPRMFEASPKLGIHQPQQPCCLQQNVGLSKFCDRSRYLLLSLQPFAACLSLAPSLPGATHVRFTCSPLSEGSCLLLSFFIYLHFSHV